MPRFEFSDSHYADLAALVLSIRDARLAHAAAKAKVAEWDAFADLIRRGQRTAAPLPTLADEARSWASGWWRRAHARHERESPREQTR
jgi:hypothetical protein